MKFVIVKCYQRGVSNDPIDVAFNVDQIVSFCAGSLNRSGVDEVEEEVVYIDTTMTTGRILACSFDEFVLMLDGKQGELR